MYEGRILDARLVNLIARCGPKVSASTSEVLEHIQLPVPGSDVKTARYEIRKTQAPHRHVERV